jgi:hypothetical protein
MEPRPPKRPRAEVERRSLLTRVLELPVADQLAFQRTLTDTAGGQLGEELEREREVRRRHEAIEAMRQASRSLDLPDERAPSVQEYKKAARETTLPLSFAAVYEAFDGRWGLARDAYEGVPIPKTAAQRATGRQARRAHAFQDPIVGLQACLAEMPESVALLPVDYQRWAQERNERRVRGERRFIESSDTLWARLLLPWEQMLQVARAEVTMQEAREAILDVYELASHTPVQMIFGEAHPEDWQGFPGPLPLAERRWLREDLRAYKEGKLFTYEDTSASRARYKDALTREEREAWGAEAVAREKRGQAQLERELEDARASDAARAAARAQSGEPEPALRVPAFGGHGREEAETQPEPGRARGAPGRARGAKARGRGAKAREQEERALRRAQARVAAKAEREERARLREEAREAARVRAAEVQELKERERREAEEREAVRAHVAAWVEREDRRRMTEMGADGLLPEGWKPPKKRPKRYGEAHG